MAGLEFRLCANIEISTDIVVNPVTATISEQIGFGKTVKRIVDPGVEVELFVHIHANPEIVIPSRLVKFKIGEIGVLWWTLTNRAQILNRCHSLFADVANLIAKGHTAIGFQIERTVDLQSGIAKLEKILIRAIRFADKRKVVALEYIGADRAGVQTSYAFQLTLIGDFKVHTARLACRIVDRNLLNSVCRWCVDKEIGRRIAEHERAERIVYARSVITGIHYLLSRWRADDVANFNVIIVRRNGQPGYETRG